MSIISKPYTFVNNTQTADGMQVNANFNALFNDYNGNVTSANFAANGFSDSAKLAKEVVTQAKTQGVVYTQDMFGSAFVESGGVATKDGTTANILDVTGIVAYTLQSDGSFRRISNPNTSFTTNVVSTTYYLDLNPDGSWWWGTAHTSQQNYLAVAQVTTDASGNISAVSDKRVMGVNLFGSAGGSFGLGGVFLNVKAYGALGDGVTNDSTAFTNAMQDASSKNLPLFVPPGTYLANVQVANDNVHIIGSGRPYYDSTSGNFIGGTIIKGQINGNSHMHLTVENLGVDSRGQLGANDDAAVTSGQTAGANPIYHTFRNLAMLGDGYNAQKHALLLQAGTHNTVEDISMFYWYHGVAIRSGFANVNNIHGYACGFTTIIVKSATGNNATVEYININNVIIDGDTTYATTRGGQVHVQSYNTGCVTQFVNINNVTSNNGGNACVLVEQVAGTCSRVTVTNAKAQNCGDTNARATFDVSAATDVVFTNCASDAATGYSFRVTNGATRVRVYAGNSTSAGVGDYTGHFDHLELNSNVLNNTLERINLTQATDSQILLQAGIVAGATSVAASTTQNMLTATYGGASGDYSSLIFELNVSAFVGGVTTFHRYRVAVSRNGTSTLTATIQEDGTALNAGGTPAGAITVSTNTATANEIIVTVTTPAYAVDVAYTAIVVTNPKGDLNWALQNAL